MRNSGKAVDGRDEHGHDVRGDQIPQGFTGAAPTREGLGDGRAFPATRRVAGDVQASRQRARVAPMPPQIRALAANNGLRMMV